MFRARAVKSTLRSQLGDNCSAASPGPPTLYAAVVLPVLRRRRSSPAADGCRGEGGFLPGCGSTTMAFTGENRPGRAVKATPTDRRDNSGSGQSIVVAGAYYRRGMCCVLGCRWSQERCRRTVRLALVVRPPFSACRKIEVRRWWCWFAGWCWASCREVCCQAA